MGGSYGAGNYAMCGRGLDPRFIFAWPNSKVAVMGGQQAGMVLRIVAEGKQRANGIEPDPKVLDMLQQTTAQKLDSQSTALYGTARLWDDGIIDPATPAGWWPTHWTFATTQNSASYTRIHSGWRDYKAVKNGKLKV